MAVRTIHDCTVKQVYWDHSKLYQSHAPNKEERGFLLFSNKTVFSLPLDPPGDYSWLRNVLTLLWHVKMQFSADVSDDGVIVDVRMAVSERVRKVLDADRLGIVRVFLGDSPLTYYVRPGPSSGFVELLRDSIDQRLVIDARDDGEIVRVSQQVHPSAPDEDQGERAQTCQVDLGRLTRVEEHRARDLFQEVSRRDCCLPYLSASCVPNLFPDTGCWARAHVMCQMLADLDIEAGKAWIYSNIGNLRANSHNHPNCALTWNYHVAPVVRIGDGAEDLLVLDPAAFCAAVPYAKWRNAFGRPDACVVTDRLIFRQSTYCVGVYETKGLLAHTLMHLHAYLIARAKGSATTPPYAKCRRCPNDP
jgi:hypothetical protein